MTNEIRETSGSPENETPTMELPAKETSASAPATVTAEAMYQQKSAQFAAEAERCGRHAGKLILARGLTFLAGSGCLLMGYLDSGLRPVWIVGGILLLLAFLTFAIIDDVLKRRQEHLLLLRKINQWQLARQQRRWNGVPVPDVPVPREHVAVANDLDLFGHASLFQLICLANTPRGVTMLRDWILEPASRDEITQRQDAVRELAPEAELREELVLRGHMLIGGIAGPESFIRWVEGQPLLAQYPWLKWVSRCSPLVGLLAIATIAFGWLPVGVGATLGIVVLTANVLLSVAFTGRVHDIFDNIATRKGETGHYLALFDLIGQIPTKSSRLADIQQLVVKEDGGARQQLKRLNRIMRLASLRHDALLSILYFGLQATMLWDLHALWLLERWQCRCQHQVRRWFDALGQLEALASLSCLAFDNPLWCFPEIGTGSARVIRGKGVGHPLLSDAARVVNDVEVGPAGTVLLVTGSNMSGKSTLLRSIGLNALLAEAGGPVCAESLQLPPLTVATSMRIQDSLEDGVSFFMAELKRLKSIVDQATAFTGRDDRTMLYLLDEILQGTNSVERHLAVARVLAHLVAKGAIGAVSTHDLQLATSPELADCCRAVHFRETLHGDSAGQQMTFDYQLREGVATTTNAMKLLELVGLVAPED